MAPRPHHALLLLLLLALLRRPAAASMCHADACNRCKAACPRFSILSAEYSDCAGKLLVAKSKFLTPATDACKITPCVRTLLRHSCWLVPNAAALPAAQLLARLDAARRAAVQRKIGHVLTTNQVRHAMARDLKVASYAAHARERLLHIEHLFSDALRARAHATRQSDYLQGAAYRDVRMRVRRYTLEAKEWKRQHDFWRGILGDVRTAMATSPRALGDVLKAVNDERQSHSVQARVVAGLRSAELDKEDRAKLAVQLKLAVREKTDEIRSLSARLRSEEEFLKKAEREIFGLFQKVSRSIARSTVSVECGDGALADVITKGIQHW